MNVKYFGNSCFLISSGKAKLVTNPYDEDVKINLKETNPDIVVASHLNKSINNSYYLVSDPGEYEIKDIFIYGYMSDAEREDNFSNIYLFDVEGVYLCYIDKNVGNVKQSILNEIGMINILFVSLSNESRIKLQKLVDIVDSIEPQIVIPMDYNKENLEHFSKILGVKSLEEESRLKVKRSDFTDEEMPIRVVVLKK